MDINNEEDMETEISLLAQDKDIEDAGSTSARNDDGKKSSHSEIEKRRRDKLNFHITELARILPIPLCRSRKFDKLTVLKKTVQYMKEVRGLTNSYIESRLRHPLISDKELNNLIIQITDGFVFAVSCHRGEISYMSKSVIQILGYSPEDLMKNSIFDYVHPKDVHKLKEQLFCSDVLYTDSSDKDEKYNMCIGARRSFLCRMKHKEQFDGKKDADTTTDSKNGQPDSQYSVIQCTGYLKPWKNIHKYHNLLGKNLDQEVKSDNLEETMFTSANDVSYLVAVGRVVDTLASASNISDTAKLSRFDFKFTVDGKFLIADQNATVMVGFLPQELLGNSMFEYIHPDDISRLINIHKATLQECHSKDTEIYRFRTKDNNYIHLRSEWKCFKNPWSNKIDFITAKNYVIRPNLQSTEKEECSSRGRQSQSNMFGKHQMFKNQYLQPNVMLVENQIKSHLEACKIGKYVVDSYLDKKKEDFDIKSTPSSTLHDLTEKVCNKDNFQSVSSVMTVLNDPCTSSSRGGDTHGSSCAVSANSVVQDNVKLSSITSTHCQSVEDVLSDEMTSPSQPQSCSDTNDEMDISILMNMLEAEAGLGGSVDNSGFPWSLP